MTQITEKYLEKLQEDLVNEGFILTSIIAYFVLMFIMVAKLDYDMKKVKELVKEITPKIKNDIEKLEKAAIPQIQKISKDLYNDLVKLKGTDLETMNTLQVFLSASYKNPDPDPKEVLKDLLDKNILDKAFKSYIEFQIQSVVERYKKSKRKVKIVTYIYHSSFFNKFFLYFIDDSWERIPGSDNMSERELEKRFKKIGYIIAKHDKKVQDICAATFKTIENRINKHLKEKEKK
jgi:hypothetical protein